jgi:hypothetical protein
MRKINTWSSEVLRRNAAKKFHKTAQKKGSKQIGSSTQNKLYNFWIKRDLLTLEYSRFELYEFLKTIGFITKDTEVLSSNFRPPKRFSLTTNTLASLEFIASFVKTVCIKYDSSLNISFKDCIEVDQAALFVLNVLRMDLQEFFDQQDSKLLVRKRVVKFTIEKSNSQEVNRLLFMNRLILETEVSNDGPRMHPVNSLGYFKVNKAKKYYLEYATGLLTTKMVRYINECLAVSNYQLSKDGVNAFEGLVGEILNNAEDHSPFSTYYVTCYLMKEENSTAPVSQLNISCLNFGASIYDGFESNKHLIPETYDLMEQLFIKVNSGIFAKQTKDNLFTLYALQDGISRLSYRDNSRGTGTMKFINSFFLFGDYKDKKMGYDPALTILSGKSHLICDTKYQPFFQSGRFYLSLNSENDLSKSPDSDNLKSIGKVFPGTLLTAELFIKKAHLDNKLKGNGNG